METRINSEKLSIMIKVIHDILRYTLKKDNTYTKLEAHLAKLLDIQLKLIEFEVESLKAN